MKRGVQLAAWLILVLVGAAVLRLPDLQVRPMHCDEAVHGIKFGQLLEQRHYVYNPYEYHGPSLNLLTLPVARAARTETISELSEVHLRLVPAVFGLVLIGLLWLVRGELGHGAVAWAGLLTAASGAMVFYSRYYIQEMLLVAFTFGAVVALWRLARHAAEPGTGGPRCRLRPAFWIAVLGLCVGMMHASKETCIIALFAMAVAAVVTLGDLRRVGAGRLALGSLAVLLVAAAVSALLFSSFFRNPAGVVDSYTTYFHYLGRASGVGSAGVHDHPWHYYFRILFWWPDGGGSVWSEAPIALLALVALAAAAWGRGIDRGTLPFVRFVAVYTTIMTVVYTLMPYKTPWCALGFFHGMILLAGVGAAVLVRAAPGRVLKGVAVLLLLVAAGHLTWQAHRASFADSADRHNPYVYAHTTHDVPLLVQEIGTLARCHGAATAMPLQVICPDDDYWPLPWDLRAYGKAEFRHGKPPGTPAPVIVTQPPLRELVAQYLYEDPPPGSRPLYMPLASPRDDGTWQIRPFVPLEIYVRRDLWETYQEAGSEPRAASPAD